MTKCERTSTRLFIFITLLESHKTQVCFPGGMVDEYLGIVIVSFLSGSNIFLDHSIIQTSLREMQEETGIEAEGVDVLGILRCNWSEVDTEIGSYCSADVLSVGGSAHGGGCDPSGGLYR